MSCQLCTVAWKLRLKLLSHDRAFDGYINCSFVKLIKPNNISCHLSSTCLANASPASKPNKNAVLRTDQNLFDNRSPSYHHTGSRAPANSPLLAEKALDTVKSTACTLDLLCGIGQAVCYIACLFCSLAQVRGVDLSGLADPCCGPGGLLPCCAGVWQIAGVQRRCDLQRKQNTVTMAKQRMKKTMDCQRVYCADRGTSQLVRCSSPVDYSRQALLHLCSSQQRDAK